MWRDQVAMLSSNYDVITPAFCAGPRGDVPQSLSMSLLAANVASHMDELGIESAVIGGLSMGGYVALAFYKLFPSRVSGLILADTRQQADTDEIRQNRKVQAEKVLAEGMPAIVDTLLAKLLTAKTINEEPAVVERVRVMMNGVLPECAAAELLGMAEREDNSALLPQVSVPTLIVVGREDPITPVQVSEEMHRDIKGSRLEIIEGASHLVNIEQPKAFNAALESFLERV